MSLSRAEKRNAFNAELVQAIKQTYMDLNTEPGIRAIVLKGEGKAFSAGADLGYIKSLRANSLKENEADSMALADMFEAIYQSPKLTISAVHGPALAGGCGLATVTDLCYASSDASFGYTEARIGFIPAIVMVYLLSKTSMQTARDLMLTARVIDAKEALDLGLVSRILPTEGFHELVLAEVEKTIMSTSGQSIEMIKEMLRKIPELDHDASLKWAAALNAKARNSEDCIKGMDAFLNKETLNW